MSGDVGPVNPLSPTVKVDTDGNLERHDRQLLAQVVLGQFSLNQWHALSENQWTLARVVIGLKNPAFETRWQTFNNSLRRSLLFYCVLTHRILICNINETWTSETTAMETRVASASVSIALLNTIGIRVTNIAIGQTVWSFWNLILNFLWSSDYFTLSWTFDLSTIEAVAFKPLVAATLIFTPEIGSTSGVDVANLVPVAKIFWTSSKN